jgi:hypothetical protein
MLNGLAHYSDWWPAGHQFVTQLLRRIKMFMKKLLASALLGNLFVLNMAEAGAGAAEDKKIRFCNKEYDADTHTLIFAFGNGTTVEWDLNKVPAENQAKLLVHGASQKGGDSYAGAKGNYTEGIADLQAVIAAVNAGEWSPGRGDSEARPRLADLAAALARVKNLPLEQATAVVEAADDDKRKTWRAHPRIKAAIAAIKSEKAQAELEASQNVADIEV